MQSRLNFTSGLAAVATTMAVWLIGTNAAAAEPPESPLYGEWVNPKGEVVVEIRSCGFAACGRVVWASAAAKADALAGSGKTLVGLRVLDKLSTQKPGVWRGRIYIPDKNLTVRGSARLIDDTGLRIKGCLVGKFLCKTQVWSRREQAESGAQGPPYGYSLKTWEHHAE